MNEELRALIERAEVKAEEQRERLADLRKDLVNRAIAPSDLAWAAVVTEEKDLERLERRIEQMKDELARSSP